MGAKVECRARWQGRESSGAALLETDELVFRGDFRVRVPLREVTAAEARDGELRVAFGGEELRLELGARAARWAKAITSPPGVLDKLGVRDGMRVAVVGALPEPLAAALAFRALERVEDDADLVLLAAEELAALDGIPAATRRLRRDGALWVVRPKGPKGVPEAAVMAAGKDAGLVDVKVARISDTHTGEKFVYRLADRAGRA